MKSIKILSLLVLIWSVVSCVDNNLQDERPIVGSVAPIQIYASSEGEMSRTSVQDGKSVDWSEGDAIAYFPRMNSNVQYQLHSTTPTEEGYCIFKRVTENVVQGEALNYIYAVYPYAADVTLNSEGNISLQLPEVQCYAENSFGLGANTMVAVTKDTDDTFLKFKNVCGYIMLQLYGENVTVKSITLTGNNDEKLAGKATVTPIYGQEPTIAMSDDATTSITLKTQPMTTLSLNLF